MELEPLSFLVSDFDLDLLPLDDLVQGHDRRKAEAPDQPDVKGRNRDQVELGPDHKTRVEKLEIKKAKIFFL